ncbi:MAG: agmatine deiminase family protein [Planctomycetota bacterium]
MHISSIVLGLAVISASAQASTEPAQKGAYYDTVSSWDEAKKGPMPRWREGGTPPWDPKQSITPRTYNLGGVAGPPTSGLISSPPEYAPSSGVIFRYSTSAWSGVVTDCVVALTADPAYDDIAYVVVSSTSQRSAAQSQFASAGADMSKVVFFIAPNDSIWLRDYGPHFIWQNGNRAIADSHYYPTRPLDNFVPTLLAEDFLRVPGYHMGLYYSGGNFQPGPNRSGFVTNLIFVDNPGFGEQYIAELYNTHQGIDTLYVFPRLPSYVDGTGHIDMWFYMVDDDTVIISQFLPGEDSTAITITSEAARFMEQELGYEVIRVPDHNGYHPGDSNCHYTYTNAYRVNNRIFIPSYGEGNASHLARDAEALAAWQAAAPEAEIIPINCYPIIYAAGAIHCIVMQVPKYQSAFPAAHVIAPHGGEFMASNSQAEIEWVATDNDELDAIDLYFSADGGQTFDTVIATGESDDGHFTWTIPPVETEWAYVKVVAHDGEGNSVEAVGESACEVGEAFQHVYDFSTGAGQNRWAWGYQTSSWTSLNGIRHPVSMSNELSATNYGKLAHADATGGDTDPDRYRSPIPSGGWETSHIFEFVIEEDPDVILDINLLWEGYGDACIQMEMYVWDNVLGQWSDSAGTLGENRYADNAAQNRDAILNRHIRSDFHRYIDEDGRLTMLLYGERSGQESMHDYVSVTVSFGEPEMAIPAVSQWGVVMLLLLVGVAGSVVFAGSARSASESRA